MELAWRSDDGSVAVALHNICTCIQNSELFPVKFNPSLEHQTVCNV